MEQTQAQTKLKLILQRRIEEGWAQGFAVGVSDAQGAGFAVFAGETAANLRNERVGIGADTRFNVGSVTKPVTAMLLAKLVESGEVALTDKVRSIVPEYPFEDTDLFHLLSHTAGYDPDQAAPLERPLVQAGPDGWRAYLDSLYRIRDRRREPGQSVLYFTEGYAIIADVIERVSGTELGSLAREVLFDPLEMSRTTFDVVSARDCGSSVFPVAADGRAMLELADWATTGDSGLYTCLDDLLKLGRLFLNGGSAGGRTVLHERTVNWLLADASGGRWNQTPAFWVKSSADRYGCFGDLHSPAAVGHTGFSGCMLWIDPASRIAGAILTNSTRLHEDWSRYKRINNRLLTTDSYGQLRA